MLITLQIYQPIRNQIIHSIILNIGGNKYVFNIQLKIIHSDAGHDGFLLEQDQVAEYITGFLAAHD